MIRERFTVSEQPTPLCGIGHPRTGVMLVNTGDTEVVVDRHEDVRFDGPDAGLTIGAGQTVTIPSPDTRHGLMLYAATRGGSGEVTYLAFG
jgi:hypothetical protein